MANKKDYIRLGDEITYREIGKSNTLKAKVTHIDKIIRRGETNSVPVKKIAVKLLDLVTMTLDNGKWCHGKQVLLPINT
jgi:hypothetical protein